MDTHLRLYKTELADRTLWYDGESSYHPDQIISIISKGHKVEWVDYMTQDIATYNKIATKDQQICIRESCNPLNLDWNIPVKYLEMDVIDYIINQHDVLTSEMNGVEIEERDQRLAEEIVKFQELGLIDVLRTMIYIMDRLAEENVVYGVGRGSSVSSYLLYILKVHDVDSYKYDLDMNDFLHE